jgi:hypothetical protein
VFAPALRALLAGWRSMGYRVVSLREYAAGLNLAHLPRRNVVLQSNQGTGAPVATEGEEFLAI